MALRNPLTSFCGPCRRVHLGFKECLDVAVSVTGRPDKGRTCKTLTLMIVWDFRIRGLGSSALNSTSLGVSEDVI